MVDYINSKLIDLFQKELSNIKDSTFRSHIENILNKVQPCHAWLPASATGKYHPDYAQGDGGLVRHVKVVVQNLLTLMDSMPELEIEHDDLIGAAIVHDFCKYDTGDSSHTLFEHPALMGDMLLDEGLKNCARLVRTHQGRWNTSKYSDLVNEKPEKIDEYVLHFADMFASRIYLHVDFDENGEIVQDPRISNKVDASPSQQ